jgi:putative transcriptional regulator
VNNTLQNSDKEFLILLGNQIKKIRLSKKISQTEIAYRCGFDKSNYNPIEAGKRNPTIITLIKIANALEVNLQELIILKNQE